MSVKQLCVVSMSLLFIFGCNSNQSPHPDPPATQTSANSVVGTWRLYSMTEGSKTVVLSPENQFFIRFYADGNCASWPVPKEEIYRPGAFNTDANRTSRGKYTYNDGILVLMGPTVKATVKLTADSMTVINRHGDNSAYKRINPDLEPGELLK